MCKTELLFDRSFLHKTDYPSIAFGDSYSYVLGTSGRQNYSFIGDYQHIGFSSQQLLNNKIVQSQV